MSKGHGKGKDKDKSDFFQIQDCRIAKDQVCAYVIEGGNVRFAFKDIQDLMVVVTEEEIAMLDDIFLD